MQRLAAYSVRTCLAGLLVAVLASGCASTNVEPARMFAAETAKLSAVLPPMLAGTHDSCMANSMRKQILLSKAFDAAANEEAAAATCAPVLPTSPQVASINAINEIVLAYANSIAAAANGDLKSFSAEGKSLGDALGSLPRTGSGTPVLDEGKLSLAVKLGQFLASQMTLRRQKATLRDLLARHDEVHAATDLLKEYAQRTYRAGIDAEARDLALLRTYVAGTARTEPLAANYIDTRLYMEGKQLAERQRLADEYYVGAIDGMQASLASLRANLDSMQEPALKRQLEQFRLQVAALQRQATLYAPVRW